MQILKTMNKPLLSIGIPTYNRPEMLFQQVSELLSFIKNSCLSGEIELIVVDNHSEYDVFSLLSSMAGTASLKIFKNDKNLGMSKNIIRTIEESNGEYYFFIGDDDRFDLDGLREILDLLKFKYFDNSVITCLNPNIEFQKYFFGDIKNYSDEVIKISLSKLQFYYIGNACSFVKTSLCKKFVKNHIEIASSLPVPQAMCATYAVIESGEITKINIPVLRNVAGKDFENSVVSSWSLLYTRVLIPRLAMLKMASTYNIQLRCIDIFNRHPELRPLNFITLTLRIAFYYWFVDSYEVRNKFKFELRKVKEIGIFYKLLLTIISYNFSRFFALCTLNFLCFIRMKFALNLLEKVHRSIDSVGETKINKSRHYWGMGDF